MRTSKETFSDISIYLVVIAFIFSELRRRGGGGADSAPLLVVEDQKKPGLNRVNPVSLTFRRCCSCDNSVSLKLSLLKVLLQSLKKQCHGAFAQTVYKCRKCSLNLSNTNLINSK